MILHGHLEIRNFSSSELNRRKEISYLQAAMQCSIYFIKFNVISKHFTIAPFCCERRERHVIQATLISSCVKIMLFSRVKIRFRAKAHLYKCDYKN